MCWAVIWVPCEQGRPVAAVYGASVLVGKEWEGQINSKPLRNSFRQWSEQCDKQAHGTDGKAEVLGAQSCLTACNPIDRGPPGSSVHRILQARKREWVAIPFSRGSFWPRDRTQVSYTEGRFFTVWVTRTNKLYDCDYLINRTLAFCAFVGLMVPWKCYWAKVLWTENLCKFSF